MTSLPSPARLILSQTPVFLDYYLDDTTLPRLRSSTGFHPFLPKVAFPHMGIMYQEDWADYTGMEVPYVIQRLVVADYRVAGVEGLSAVMQQGAAASREWWEPIRQNIAVFFEESEHERMSVTYIFRAGAMREEDQAALMQALHKLGEDRNVDVRLVDAVDYGDEEWGERMAALIKSNVSERVSPLVAHLLIFSTSGDSRCSRSGYLRRRIPQTLCLKCNDRALFSRYSISRARIHC